MSLAEFTANLITGMESFANISEPQIRLLVFGGTFLCILFLERLVPRTKIIGQGRSRWLANVSISVINTIFIRLLLPFSAVELARLGEQSSWGLFAWFAAPFWLKVLASLIVLDLVIYLQHVLFHYQPLLWRLHRVHHADTAFDLTTGIRFHPCEIFLSMGIKFATIVLLGIPALAVLIFEILLNAFALFSHGNFRLPAQLDFYLRKIIVTSEMHRIHHSSEPLETNSNFGFQLSLWDRLFGNYRELSRNEAQIGLETFREKKFSALVWMLVIPFLSRKIPSPKGSN